MWPSVQSGRHTSSPPAAEIENYFQDELWWFLQNLWIVGVADDHWAEDEGGQDDDPCSPED